MSLTRKSSYVNARGIQPAAYPSDAGGNNSGTSVVLNWIHLRSKATRKEFYKMEKDGKKNL